MLSKIKDQNFVVDRIRHIKLEDFEFENFEHFCNLYARKYNLNLSHLERYAKAFGYGVFKYIENERIRAAINLDDENFEKYMQIFTKNNFISDELAIKNILFGLSQYEYKRDNDEMINLFSYIMQNVAIGDMEEAWILLYEVVIESFDEITKFLNISSTDVDEVTYIFLKKLCEKNSTKVVDFLHEIVD